MVELALTGVDPNTVVGWLAVLGVTIGALYKVGRWIVDLRLDIARAIDMLDINQKTLTRHDRLIIYILGHLGLDMKHAEDEETHEPKGRS